MFDISLQLNGYRVPSFISKKCKQSGQVFSEREVFDILNQIAFGLYCIVISLFISFDLSYFLLDLRNRSIVHGDLKPDNILIGSDHLFSYSLLLFLLKHSILLLVYIFCCDSIG